MRKAQLRAAVASVVLVGNLAVVPAKGAGGTTPLSSGQAESQTQLPQTRQPLRVQVSLVNLFATVRDGHRALVPNLTKDDFRVYEDGREQKIAFFSKEVNLPITLGLLVDTSGSEQNLLLAEQEAASRFIHRVLRKGDESMVVSFDTDVDLLSDFTQDTAALERAIRRTRINAPTDLGPFVQRHVTSTALYDAIYLACREKLSSEAGRKALVIVTDAQDEGSKMKLRDAIEAAQRADAVIHIILIADPYYSGLGYSGGSVAKKLTEETGGRVIEVRNENKLEEAFDKISEELRSQYTLGYYPSNTTRDGGFRKIRIETARPGLHVLARRGYYAPKN